MTRGQLSEDKGVTEGIGAEEGCRQSAGTGLLVSWTPLTWGRETLGCSSALGRPKQQSRVLEHPQLPDVPMQDAEVRTQCVCTAPCSWLRCSYVGVGDIPEVWERHTQGENTPSPPQNPGVHFQPQALQSSQTHLASWVQQHVDVLGCLQPAVGWVTALQTAGQRAAACSKVRSPGTQTFSSPAGCAEVQGACQPFLCLGRSWDRQKTEPLPY